MAMQGGGSVKHIRTEVHKSFWFCFFSNIHDEFNQTMIKEVLFWSYIYHYDDTIVHLIIPPNPTLKKWRRQFNIQSFPAIVLADDPELPNKFVVFPSGLINKEIFTDIRSLVKFLDHYHNMIVDGFGFKDLIKSKRYKDLSSFIDLTWKEFKGLLQLSY